ncbi:MAG TPA: nitrogenase stabilizing/protective protein NifW [Polyangiales bacterium]
MSVLGDLQRLSAAEDFFKYLGVEYDVHVVNVARLHILRRMGEYLKRESSADASDEETRARCKAHLETAYADFVARTPIEERVFKVHKDAVKPVEPSTPKRVFVPLSSIK